MKDGVDHLASTLKLSMYPVRIEGWKTNLDNHFYIQNSVDAMHGNRLYKNEFITNDQWMQLIQWRFSMHLHLDKMIMNTTVN